MNNMKISTKIWLLVGVALMAGVCASTFLVFRLKGLVTSYGDVLDTLQRQDSAREMQVTFKKQVQAWKDILIRGSDPAALQKYSDEFHAQEGKVRDIAGTLKRGEPDPEIRGLTEQFEQAHSELGNKFGAGLQAFVQAKGLDVKEVDQMIKGQDRGPTDLIDKIVELAVNRSNTQRASLQEAVAQQIWYLSAALMLVFAVIGSAAVIVARRMSGALQQCILELSEGAQQVASAASQVSSSSQSLAQGSTEQAASLEETSASSEEINSMARKNSENSRVAADLMTQSQHKFVQTNQSLDQSVVAMAEINTQSDKIAKIIKVIDEIAFQTNILALNAAVQAARAGEAGMGFAVVPDEVRNLAQRCAQAAKDTAALIEESITKSNDGKVKVDQVATAFRAITEESAKVKTLVNEVNLGSQEQARGIEQIGKAITQVERLSAMVGGGETANGNARQAHRRTSGANGDPPRRASESGAGLSALRKAVSHLPKSTEHGAPVLAAHGASKDAFPLEEQFKEF